jgi:hypothetical protein
LPDGSIPQAEILRLLGHGKGGILISLSMRGGEGIGNRKLPKETCEVMP